MDKMKRYKEILKDRIEALEEEMRSVKQELPEPFSGPDRAHEAFEKRQDALEEAKRTQGKEAREAADRIAESRYEEFLSAKAEDHQPLERYELIEAELADYRLMLKPSITLEKAVHLVGPPESASDLQKEMEDLLRPDGDLSPYVTYNTARRAIIAEDLKAPERDGHFWVKPFEFLVWADAAGCEMHDHEHVASAISTLLEEEESDPCAKPRAAKAEMTQKRHKRIFAEYEKVRARNRALSPSAAYKKTAEALKERSIAGASASTVRRVVKKEIESAESSPQTAPH